jgi:hypothetical protein
VQLAANGVSPEIRIAVSAISGGSVVAGGAGAGGIGDAGDAGESEPPPQPARVALRTVTQKQRRRADIGSVIDMLPNFV